MSHYREASASSVDVGVIVPAISCPCNQVEAVLKQLGPRDRLVVAWNGGPTPHSCKANVRSDPRGIWLELPPKIGAAGARNKGAGSINPPPAILSFCDADDLVCADWLARLVAPLRADRADLVGGALHICSDLRGDKIVEPRADYWHLQSVFGSNCAIRSDAWLDLGGFDDTFICCEDTDLAWRAASSGLRVLVESAAHVQVSLRHTLRQEFAQRFRWGTWAVRLLRKHGMGLDHLPNLRMLLADKSASGFAADARVAALSQWAGHWWARLCRY